MEDGPSVHSEEFTISSRKFSYSIRIISKYGLKTPSSFIFESDEDEIGSFPMIYWRTHPIPVGCEIEMIQDAIPSPTHENSLVLNLGSVFDLHLEFDSKEDYDAVFFLLESHVSSSKENRSNLERLTNISTINSNQAVVQQYFALRISECQAAAKQEQVLQLCTYLKFKEGFQLLDKLGSKSDLNRKSRALSDWKAFVKTANQVPMDNDKARWRLHAAANQDRDLQAWYHAAFSEEVYRLRGPFWFRDAVLPQYRQNYDLVDSGMNPHEEAALAHVLCSPDTTYGDVAGQMFVVQAVCGALPTDPDGSSTSESLGKEEFELFERLSSMGVQVTKYPRSGRPAKKPFRVSYVEGRLYFTWKGKFGNQGVDLSQVSGLTTGLGTDILRKSGSSSKAGLYLSLLCEGRSVDLQLDSEEERRVWEGLLGKLIKKEHGELEGLSHSLPEDSDLFSWGLRYSSLGSLPPPHILSQLLSQPFE